MSWRMWAGTVVAPASVTSAGAGSVVGQAIVQDRFNGADAQRVMSHILMVFGLAPAIAPVLGGWLHVTFGWRATFVFLSLFALLPLAAGETISTELSRRVDLAQTLALVASIAGVDRAIATASRSLTTEQLASIAPMLQRVVLPAATRETMGRRGKVLQELRDALVSLTPTAHAEPAKLNRFSARKDRSRSIGRPSLPRTVASSCASAAACRPAWTRSR